MKRFISFLLCFVVVFGMVAFTDFGGRTKVQAATTNQLNIVARGDYMYNSTWVCQKTISGWNYKYTFYKGNTYHLPYAWPVHAGAYIGFGISVEDFLAAAANPNNSFYKYRSYVSGVSYSYSTYYGSDCSSFVSWAWGIKRNTTYTIPNFSTYIGSVSTYNSTYTLQLGDALNSQDHVVLVTDLKYNSSGAITQIEITEQTPPQMKRSYYTPSALSAKYGGSYSIYRYYGTVPPAPNSKPSLPNTVMNIGDSFTATISNINANKNVAVNSDNNVVIADKAYDTAQQWKFTRRDNGSYEIKNVKTGKCLDVNASSSSAGANVQVWDDYDNEAQSWYLYNVDGKFVLRPGCSSDCVLDVAGSATTAGSNVATWTFNACDAQKFEISHIIPNEPVNLGESFIAKITNAASGMNLSVYEPNNVVIYHDTTSPAQRWKFVRQADGSYEITNLKYGTCLDVSAGKGLCGDNVQLWDDINSSAQRWFIYSVGDSYVLRPQCSFDCVLDVEGGFSDDNTNVEIWTYNSGSAQKFKINKLSILNGYDAGYAGGIAGDGKIYAHGLDISSWQGTGVDFAAIKAAGYDYIILRAGTSKGKDTCFETLYTNAKAAGLDVGAYYYSYATSIEDASVDAQNMLTWVQGKLFEYPLYFDYEDSSQNNLSAETSKAICLTFMDRLANAGYLTGMYTGYYKSTTLPMSEICAKYESWIAHYYDYTYQTLSPSYSTRFGMYQYTDRNYVNGAGPYDGNVAFKDYPSIVKQYGFNGYASSVTEDAPSYSSELVNLGTDFYAKVTNVGSGKNLSIYEPNNVVIYQSSTNPAQEWHFVRQSDGSYEITNVKYGKILDADTGLGNAGDNVQLWDDIDSTAQRWFIYSSGDSYVMRPACSEDCVLDVAGSATANDSNVHIWTFNGCNAQKFTITQILPRNCVDLGESFVAKITNAASQKNLSIYEPRNVVLYQNSTSPAQQWKFVRQSDGSYEITNVKYNQCLDVEGGLGNSGDNVEIWEDINNTAQRWFVYSVNGHYVLKPACSSDSVLDVFCGYDADNTNIQIATYNAGEPQLFDIRKISPDDYADIGKYFTATITNVNADKRLDLTDTDNVVINSADSDSSQKWLFVRQSDGSYEIINAKNRKLLNVDGGTGTAGENVSVKDDNDSSSQRWYVYALDSGQYILRPACATDSVLDIAGSGVNDGSNVATWTYNGLGAQLFTINKIIPDSPENLGDDFIAKITNIKSGMNVSVLNGDSVVIYENTASQIQQWHFVRQSDGSYEITNVYHGINLDVEGASGAADTNVRLWEDTDSTAQRWFVYKQDDGYILRPACSDNCILDVYEAGEANNTNVAIWYFHSGDAQIFDIRKIDTEKYADLGKSFLARITNVNADKNLSIYEPQNAVIYQKSDNLAQWWRFDRRENGSYEITNIKYNLRLDVEWGLGNSGDNVCIWEDLNNAGQSWFIYETYNGKYVLRPECSDNCVLNVEASATANDSNVQIYTYNGSNSQMFTFDYIDCEHNWSDGVCAICGITCEHDYKDGNCTVCGVVCKHTYENGKCTVCGVICEHNWSDGACTTCGITCEHDYKDGNCTTCGIACKHTYENGECTVCGVVCTHTYENGICIHCGEKEVVEFVLAGANMVLGNNLKMNFFIDKEDISGNEYYAEVVHYAVDETFTYTIPYEQWEERTSYMVVTLDSLAARHMSDKIEVLIYDSDGTQESVLWQDSIRDYAMRIMNDQTAKTRTMLVDMLNYGAAAQVYFDYNKEELANDRLTDEQQSWATQAVECADQREKGTNYFGSTLVLKNCILLTMYFENISQDMYATVTFTDHKGNYHERRVNGADFARYNDNIYGVTVDDLVVADGNQLVTINVYTADGTLVAYAKDSVNSYAGRMIDSDPLFEMVAKFTESAYIYLH